jgi:LCP family protein required for cell wall assembly
MARPVTPVGTTPAAGIHVDVSRGGDERGQGSAPQAPPPEYKVYRSRRGPIGGLRRSDLDALRRRLGGRRGREPGARRELSPGRIVKWVAVAVGGWLLLSFLLFLLSAQVEPGVAGRTKQALSSQGTLLGGSTILVLGSDRRGGASIDRSQTGPPRSDTIMLLHVALGSVRKLSIPRDSLADVPGHGTAKINAAYAIGGAPLTIETVEHFLGNRLKIDHLIEIDFKDFPAFINALGGVTIDVPKKVCSPPFDNFWKGLRFKRGKQHLDGNKALGYARIRKNRCAPSESDIERTQRQQQLLSAIRHQFLSATTFFRLPWASWKAPKSIRTDLRGPGLMALAADLATGGSGQTKTLEPSCLGCGPGGTLLVSDGEKRDEVKRLLGK